MITIIVTGVIYPIQTHWAWGPDGWLGSNGYYDFAGSGVVHLAGATCALVGKDFGKVIELTCNAGPYG